MLEPISPNPESDAKLAYSQGMVVRGETRTLYISGQVAADAAGQVAPDFEGQVRQVWTNLIGVLSAANMKVTDLIKVTAFLTDTKDFPVYVKLRAEFLSGHKPTSTLLVVSALARPEWKIEVEAVAVSTSG
ncbi:RidA family protein [Pseudolabrys taiwanensis]|uniref:RidA family protein n=1 Tax=Pseudolabrys taiwanensis TaxID=331696 RepID=A0A345ZYM7_9HYPH|nr:RidA family protein [Pseudolabrys taiwanensis]AXK82024.1 RidA family protein [Pseudolabrys taiwanensis]